MIEEDYGEYTVLVVDDDEVQREVLSELVRSLGAKCETAENAASALEKLRTGSEYRYSMMITDIFMPGDDGFVLAEKIRAMIHPQAHTFPILGVSADTDPELYDRAITAGMNGMMLKPVGASVLSAYFTLMFKAQRVSSVFTARLQRHVDSERKMREFVQNTSRSLRTPLQAIMGFAQLLSQEKISDEDRLAFAESISTACESASKTLNDSQIEFDD